MDLGEIFGVIMSVGAIMFIVVVLASIFTGERIAEDSAPWPKVEDATLWLRNPARNTLVCGVWKHRDFCPGDDSVRYHCVVLLH